MLETATLKAFHSYNDDLDEYVAEYQIKLLNSLDQIPRALEYS